MRRAGFITAMAVMGIFLACGQRSDHDDFVRREIAEFQKRTIPPGSNVLIQSGPKQNGRSKSASWEFETSWDWVHYEEWVTSQLQPEFVIRRVDGVHLLFIRSLHGDSEQLRLQDVSGKPKLKVKVEFVAYPD